MRWTEVYDSDADEVQRLQDEVDALRAKVDAVRDIVDELKVSPDGTWVLNSLREALSDPEPKHREHEKRQRAVSTKKEICDCDECRDGHA